MQLGPRRGLQCPSPSFPPRPSGLPAWDSSLATAHCVLASGMSPIACIRGFRGLRELGCALPLPSPGLPPSAACSDSAPFPDLPPAKAPSLSGLPVASFDCAPGPRSPRRQSRRAADSEAVARGGSTHSPSPTCVHCSRAGALSSVQSFPSHPSFQRQGWAAPGTWASSPCSRRGGGL